MNENASEVEIYKFVSFIDNCDFAVAAPVWVAQTWEFKDGRSDEFVEGLNTFMGSIFGKKAPGQVSINWVSVNVAYAATHGMVMNFPSMAAYQEWNQLF